MGFDLVFSPLVLTRVFYYLDLQSIGHYALANKDCYYIARRYGSKYIRWALTTEERLNHFLYDKFVKAFLQYIEAVAIPAELSFWSALVIIGQVKPSDVQLVLNKPKEVKIHTIDLARFDTIKILSIKYTCSISMFWIDGLPTFLEKLFVYCPLEEFKAKEDLLCIVAELPNTLTCLHLEKQVWGIQHRQLPGSLIKLHLDYPSSYDWKPIFFKSCCLNLEYLFVKSKNPHMGIEIGKHAVYPKLKFLYLCCDFSSFRMTRAEVHVKNLPMLKTLIATRLVLNNEGNRPIKRQLEVDSHSTIEFY